MSNLSEKSSNIEAILLKTKNLHEIRSLLNQIENWKLNSTKEELYDTDDDDDNDDNFHLNEETKETQKIVQPILPEVKIMERLKNLATPFTFNSATNCQL